IQVALPAVARRQTLAAGHDFFQVHTRFAWLIDYPTATRLRRKNRELERTAIAAAGILSNDVTMFGSSRGRFLGFRRNLRPLRLRGGNKKQKKDRGAKLSHRTCRSKPGTAD